MNNTQMLYGFLRAKSEPSFITLESEPTTYRVMTYDSFLEDDSGVFLQHEGGAKWIDDSLASEILEQLKSQNP